MSVPPQLEQQIIELTQQLTETVNKLKGFEASLIYSQNEIRRQQITKREIEQYDDTVRLYRPIGRMYALTPKDKLYEDIERDIDRGNAQINELQARHQAFSKKRDEITNSIQELVASVRRG